MLQVKLIPYQVIFFLLLGLIPAAVLAGGGDIVWEKSFGGADGLDWGYGLDVGADGTLFLTGVTYSADGNVTGYHGNGDLWLVRADQNGTILYEKAYGGSETDYGLAVRALDDGGAMVIGTAGSEDGDVSRYLGMGDLWVLKLDPAGSILWEKSLGGNLTDEGGDLILTGDGGCLITGYTFSHEEPENQKENGLVWIVRLDKDGKILWERFYGGTGRDSGNSIIQASDGGYVIAGNTYSGDGDITGYHGSSDFWILKIDADGNLLWQKAYGGTGSDWAHAVVELDGGDLIVSGVTSSGDGDVTRKMGAGDIWVIRLDRDGNLLWEKTYGGSFSENVWSTKPAPGGGVYLAGESFSLDGDFSGARGEGDLWVGEVSSDGNLLWYRLLGGTLFEAGYGIAINPDQTLALIGTASSSDGDVHDAAGNGDLWVVKITGNPEGAGYPAPVTAIPAEHVPSVTGNVTVVPVQGALLPLPGCANVPLDPDSDGRYEDLNGNAQIDLQDPQLLFKHMDHIKGNYSAEFADFNLNGVPDLGDVQALFTEVSG